MTPSQPNTESKAMDSQTSGALPIEKHAPEISFERIERECGHNEQLRREGKSRGLIYDFKVLADGQHIAWWYQYQPNGGTDLKGYRYWLKDKMFQCVSNGKRYPYEHPVAAHNQREFEAVIRLNLHRIPTDAELAERKAEQERKKASEEARQEDARKLRLIEAAAPDMLAALKVCLEWLNTEEAMKSAYHRNTRTIVLKAIAKAEAP